MKMQLFKYFVIGIVILALLEPTQGNWFKKTFNTIGKGIKKGIEEVGKVIERAGCKVLYGVGCPVVVGALDKMLSSGGSGAEVAAVATGVAMAKQVCHIRKKKCKRSVEMAEIILPFSDEFSDYDMNSDKLITYEEFVFSVMKSVNMADPEELEEPFIFADFDGNGILDKDEFQGAPFLFAHSSWPDSSIATYK